MDSVVDMVGIRKVFPGVVALDGVDVAVCPGEIHALMGENGAGKSTLIKVLTGVYTADAGEIRLAGRLVSPSSPQEAERLGISTVYQEVNLIPHLSVAENILLGRQPRRFGLIRWGRLKDHAREALARLGLEIDVSRELCSYSVAVQQMVAIARALDIDARLVVLDEPTSSLDEQEVEELFRVMRRLRDRGLGIVFITHFLDQVYRVADRISVLRNGALVGSYEATDLARVELVGRMLGKPVEALTAERSGDVRASDRPPAQDEAPLLEADGLGRRGSIAPFDLEVRRGDVVGFAGLLGSGRSEAARLLFGIERATTGEVRIEGERVLLRSPRRAIDHGIGFCSEDRKTEGLVPHLSVRENLVLALQASRGAIRRLAAAEQVRIVEHYIAALDIRTPDADTPIRNLSGGNQQKVLLARWLALQPRVIILDEPTRGIDVGAKAEIEALVDDLRRRGLAVLFISSELEEVVRTCGRVVVLRDRRKVAELSGPDVDLQSIMHTIARTHGGDDA